MGPAIEEKSRDDDAREREIKYAVGLDWCGSVQVYEMPDDETAKRLQQEDAEHDRRIQRGDAAPEQAFGEDRPAMRHDQHAVTPRKTEKEEQDRHLPDGKHRHGAEDEEDEDRRARRIHHERLSPRDNAVEIPVEEMAAYDTGGHQKQTIAARREVAHVNIAQEITAPKAENGHHRAVNDKVEGEEILKLTVADDLDNAAEGVAEGLGRAVVKGVAGRRIANDEAAEDQRAKADDRGNPEDGAPSDHIGKQRRWRRREEVADTAHRDDKREVEGETLRRQPARDDD